MKRSVLISLFAFGLGACATVSGTPESTSPSKSALSYEEMASAPPSPRKEDAPRLSEKEVWVPGYYQPVAGTWVWHQGEVRETKEGYTLIPAGTHEEKGKYVFSPPRWRRSDLASQSK
ncbi:MAG: hypothetical protein JWN44_3385 [Myxococcales bacterium]|nr:hypothetical protein [Myxococcales bacterium]